MQSDGKKELTFEAAMERLEEIVQQLQGEDVSIDESLSVFEEGIGLVALCKKKLTEVSERVEKILEKEEL